MHSIQGPYRNNLFEGSKQLPGFLGIDSNILSTGNEVLVAINVYLNEDYNLVKSVTLENSKQSY
jgi:hypothetical protein